MVLKESREQRRVLHFVKLEPRQEKMEASAGVKSEAQEKAQADLQAAQEQEMRCVKEQTGQVLQRWYGAMKDHETNFETTRTDLNAVQVAVEEARGSIAHAVAKLEAALDQRDRVRGASVGTSNNTGARPGRTVGATGGGLPTAMNVSQV